MWPLVLLVSLVVAGCKAGVGQSCGKPDDCAQGLTCTKQDDTCQTPDTIERRGDEAKKKPAAREEAERSEKARLTADAERERARRQNEVDALKQSVEDVEDRELEKLREQLEAAEKERAEPKDPSQPPPRCDPGDPLCSD